MNNLDKVGVILINLGTPNSTSYKDIYIFLKQFLTDPVVINLPKFLRLLLFYFLIIPFKLYRSRKAYLSIWMNEGAPLRIISHQLKSHLQLHLPLNYHIEIAMIYGNPSIKYAIDKCIKNECRTFKILPLFPQYASASSGSALIKTLKELEKLDPIPPFQILENFYDNHLYIKALSELIIKFKNTNSEYLIFSYHGIPLKQNKCVMPCSNKNGNCPILTKTNRDCYRAQCFDTSRKIAQMLQLTPEEYTTVFQSRFGQTAWTQPYILDVFKSLSLKGYQHLTIVTPSFVADCLETLEEINIRYKNYWKSLNGKSLTLVPCLNASSDWINCLKHIITTSNVTKNNILKVSNIANECY